MRDVDCRVCPSLAGEWRISPGRLIYEGRYWVVDHAYPSKMKGWLVLVPRRHVEAMHELTPEEFAEMGALLERTIRLRRERFNCQKEYLTLRWGYSPAGSRFIPAGIPASPRRRCPRHKMFLAAFSSRSSTRPQLVQTWVRTLKDF
jgi:hypothetical protein